MARGRMLNKSVSNSLKFDRLPDDTCRLMATWIIAHLDCNGVFYGNATVVKSLVFTRRRDVTIEQVEIYLQAMKEIGLIEFFEADGQRWQVWPGFDHNQIGLRKERENTNYPLPPIEAALPDDKLPQIAGRMPEECRNDDGKKTAESESESEVKIQDESMPRDVHWIAELEAQPPPPEARPPPEGTTPEEYQHQCTLEAERAWLIRQSKAPWLAWGTNCSIVHTYGQEDIPLEAIQRIGWLFQRAGLEPIWSEPGDVKSWIVSIRSLHEAAHGNYSLIERGIERVLRANDRREPENRFTYAHPRSFLSAIRALVGEHRRAARAPPVHKYATEFEQGRRAMKRDPQYQAFAPAAEDE